MPDTNILKQHIYDYGPVYSTLYVGSGPGEPWYNECNGYDGTYTLHYTGAETPNHAVLIVGWDDSLSHAGSPPTGGWIVKNSWGTDWGGTCGYGSENGYFYIAYGSAGIGKNSSYIYDWQNYDPDGDIMYYDEAGWQNTWGFGSTTGWGLCKFTPDSDTYVTRVEFWTYDITVDIDVYIYDNFNGTEPNTLLASKLDCSFNEAGYHSVKLDQPLAITSGDDITAIVKFTNFIEQFTIPTDDANPVHETGRTYISPTGASGSWIDLGIDESQDVAIRLRTSDTPGGTDEVGFCNRTIDSLRNRFILRNNDGTTTVIRYKKLQSYLPVTGDWDGDGTDDVGFCNRTDDSLRNRFYLRNNDGTTTVIRYKKPQSYLPVTGDWDGDGADDVGFCNRTDDSLRNRFILRNDDGTTTVVRYKKLQSYLPITGDWDGDGSDEVGFCHQTNDSLKNIFYLRADDGTTTVVKYKKLQEYLPVTGNWDGS